MAKRTASAKKQARAGAKRTVRNRAVRSESKTLVVKARKALTDKKDAAAVVMEAMRSLDRAAGKGILHTNNAARRKGRLMKQLAKLASAAPVDAKTEKAKKVAPAKAAAKKAAPKAAKK